MIIIKKTRPYFYLLLVKCLLSIPFHSSSTKLPKQTFKKSKNAAYVIKIQRVTGFDILNSFTNEHGSHETGQCLTARTRACERLKLQRMQPIVHCIANTLHKNMVQEKNYDLHLFEKQRQMYQSLTHFTSSKVVKETLIPIKSNHKTHACSFV